MTTIRSVSPTFSSTATYTLTATGASGSTTAQVTIEIPDEPLITVTSLPEPLVQGGNAGGSTTTYVLSNDGGQPTQISLSRIGEFFTQSPESFTLQPGQSQTVTLTGLTVGQDAYQGASVPSGSGVSNWFPDSLAARGLPARARSSLRTAWRPPRVSSQSSIRPDHRFSKDFTLGNNDFMLLNGIGQEILGPERHTKFGDLSNLQVEFSVIDGGGKAMIFVSSVDNGTGDSILRTE